MLSTTSSKRRSLKAGSVAWLLEWSTNTDKALGLVFQHCIKQRWLSLPVLRGTAAGGFKAVSSVLSLRPSCVI